MMARLNEQEIADGLRGLDWEYEDKVIRRRYNFPSFMSAIAFVNRVAELAEENDHHPDILVTYRTVTLTLSTHSEGGVTEKDIDLAHKADSIAHES
jgi:4a-hydroxytetrahydrobiopterin dehydratase